MGEDLFETLITKLLEFHSLNREDLVEDQNWFHRYTWKKEDKENYKTWAVNLLRKKKFPKNIAESEVKWFLLSYGYKEI